MHPVHVTRHFENPGFGPARSWLAAVGRGAIAALLIAAIVLLTRFAGLAGAASTALQG